LKKGVQSQSQRVILQNIGSARLSIASVVIGGSNGSDFSFVNGCSGMVASGGSCTIDVMSIPSEYGKRSGELRILTNDPKRQPYQLIKMTATAVPPKMRLKSSTLRPDSLMLGNSSITKTITIENRGLSDLTFNQINTAGILDLSLINHCPGRLEGGASCTMDFSFQPSNVGTSQECISIYTNDPKKPSVIIKCS
jgi:hypothetical protein